MSTITVDKELSAARGAGDWEIGFNLAGNRLLMVSPNEVRVSLKWCVGVTLCVPFHCRVPSHVLDCSRMVL
jgi:hypothetical protein